MQPRGCRFSEVGREVETLPQTTRRDSDRTRRTQRGTERERREASRVQGGANRCVGTEEKHLMAAKRECQTKS